MQTSSFLIWQFIFCYKRACFFSNHVRCMLHEFVNGEMLTGYPQSCKSKISIYHTLLVAVFFIIKSTNYVFWTTLSTLPNSRQWKNVMVLPFDFYTKSYQQQPTCHFWKEYIQSIAACVSVKIIDFCSLHCWQKLHIQTCITWTFISHYQLIFNSHIET